MRVVAFDGSKEPRGPVGTRLTRLVEALRADGVEAEVVRIEKVPATGCTMCGQCGQRTGQVGCSRPPEDGLRRCVRKLRAADAVVLGTPAYGAHASPATQELLIRLEHDRRERGDTRLAGKLAVVVVGPPGSGTAAAAGDVRRRLEAHGMHVLEAAAPYSGSSAEEDATAVSTLVDALLGAHAPGRG